MDTVVPIPRSQVWKTLEGYDPERVAIGCLGSHSALDVCDGAVEEGFHTLVACQRGRERTYSVHFRAHRGPDGKATRGVVDAPLVLGKFRDLLAPKVQAQLIKRSVLFVPNRSLTSYAGADAIEADFPVPLLGSRNLLVTEERGTGKDYYWLLKKARLPFPEALSGPEEIRELVIVKLPHAQKALERGFFTAASKREFREKADGLLRRKVITAEDLAKARIERYIIGPVLNLNFFYSPLARPSERVELLGVDWRFESSLDGHVRLPAPQQLALPDHQQVPEYTVCGHNSATLRESLLEKAFELAERWVKATQEHYAPGIIGAFCLQTCVDKDLNFWIYDVAPRIGGGTNIHVSVGHPYGNALWRTPMSTGRRIAREVRRAVADGKLRTLVT